MDVRRVVTGHDASGKSVFVSDETVEPDRTGGAAGSPSSTCCGAETRRHSSPMTASCPSWHTYFPPDRWLPVRPVHASRRTPGGAEQALVNAEEAVADIGGQAARTAVATWTRRIQACTPPTPSTSKWCSRARSCSNSTTAPKSPCTRRHRGAERNPASLEEPRRHTGPDGAVHLRRQPFGRASGVTT